MLLFLSILGIFLSAILLYFNARKNGSSIYLGILFLLISLYSFYQYVLLYSKSVFLIEILLLGFAIVFPVLYLIGPMLYWYIRSVLTDNSRLKRSDIWHLLPMTIYFMAALPYTFVPFSDKFAAATEVVKDVTFMQTYHATILDQIFPVSVFYMSRPILVLVYTLWSVGLFINYLVKKRVSDILSKQHFNDYRNEWRINHAKKLIKEGKANEITLEAVGLLSGFSSRNTFLTTFKKVEGITPGTFAAQSKK